MEVGVERWLRSGIKEFALRFYLLEMSEATPIKSHPHDCPNMNLTGRTVINMPTWTGRLQPYTKRYRQRRNAESRRKNRPPGGAAHQLITQDQMGSPENVHTSNIIHTKRIPEV